MEVTKKQGAKEKVFGPTECPGCGAKMSKSGPMEGDAGFSSITSFKCGAKTRWRSIGSYEGYHESTTMMKECRKSLPAVLGAAMKAHPKMRMGQLVWMAANMVLEPDDTNVLHIDDEDLAYGLRTAANKKKLPKIDDKSSRLAQKIQSYLTKKVDGSLNAKTVDHIAKIIRGEETTLE